MMDIVNVNLDAGHIVEVTTAPSTPPKKLSVPILGLEKFPTQQEIEGQDVRNRRPVRPIDRQRMRPWLMELLDLGNVFGLRWTNRSQGVFQISWRHASRLGWNLETDGDVFERWARHTGIYKEGDPPEPKRWKANFRCALHSLHDVMELTNAVERRGRNACRTYQFLQNNNAVNPKTKSKEKRQKHIEPKAEQRELVHVLTYERPIRQPVKIQMPESGSSDELLSETESEESHHTHQDKVIVQRLDPKSGEVAEEEYLLHDHDYSGQQDKTQRTIYLRQGVGSIVLHKEVLNAPQLLEDAKAAEALSNLEQLASAAVDSQELEGGTFMIDANVLSNKGSPSKSSSSLAEDDSALSLKKLLPRLRARIKESERAGGGMLSKRKYLEDELEMMGEKRILGHNQYRLKKTKSEVGGLEPPSPPLTRRRSRSPQKQSKPGGGAKSKRSRKESEGSASDSTEPLMSSCLLLLEAATRLDKAEKGEGMSDKKSAKHGKKGGDKSLSAPTLSGKRKRGMRALKQEFEGEEQEVIEEPVLEDMQETTVLEGSQETVIEEQIIYPEDIQIVYEDEASQHSSAEVQEAAEETVAFDILRTALENIGSEMEVSTSRAISSTPKEMAIMRRKKDNERLSSSSYNVVNESSFAKGLFSGSEIIPSVSQSGSISKKAGKFKNKSLANKDNVYYVDVRSNGGSICVKQSDGSLVDDGQEGTTSTSIGSTGSPKIFIAAGQTSSGQQIVLPVKNQKFKNASTISTINPSASVQHSSSDLTATVKHAGGKSFISLGPKGKGKPIILRPPNSSAGRNITLPPSSVSVVNQVSSQTPQSNVKISTLPIISTLKPTVSIASASSRLSTTFNTSTSAGGSSVYPVALVPNMASSPRSGQTTSLVSTQAVSETDGAGPKTIYIQPKVVSSSSSSTSASLSSGLSQKQQSARQLQFQSTSVKPGSVAATTVSDSQYTQQSTISSSSLDKLNQELEVSSSGTINAEVVMDPVKGPCLKLPNSNTLIPLTDDMLLSTSPSSGSTSQTFILHPSSGAGQEDAAETQYVEENVSPSEDANYQQTDFNQVEIYSVNNNQMESETVVKTEQSEINEQSSSSSSSAAANAGITLVQSEGQEGGMVFTIKNEDGSSYIIPVQGQEEEEGEHEDSQQLKDISSGDAGGDNNNIRVQVQTEMGDQTCFISPEQLEQANHIIHISQEADGVEDGTSSSSKIQVESAGLVNDEVEVKSEVQVEEEAVVEEVQEEAVVEEEENEQFCVSVPSSSSMSIDPRAPLAIREIPLFASSKGESDSVEENSV